MSRGVFISLDETWLQQPARTNALRPLLPTWAVANTGQPLETTNLDNICGSPLKGLV